MIEICPYPVNSGFEDVEVVYGFCEVGCNCNDKCHYNWDEEEEQKVNKIFETYSEKLTRELNEAILS